MVLRVFVCSCVRVCVVCVFGCAGACVCVQLHKCMYKKSHFSLGFSHLNGQDHWLKCMASLSFEVRGACNVCG